VFSLFSLSLSLIGHSCGSAGLDSLCHGGDWTT